MEPSKAAIELAQFIPMQFIVDVRVPETLGGEARGQIAINDRPFILQMISHQIIPSLIQGDHDVTGWWYQDGIYRLDWSLYEQARFWKGVPPMADAGFGSVRHGNWIKLPAPVSLSGNQTLHVRIINQVARQEGYFVQTIFHGIQKSGAMSQIGQ